MRVENIRFEKDGTGVKAVAKVTWEDHPRRAQEVYFGTIEDFADGLTCNPHAFLVACIMPAMHFGERRLRIDGEICPELINGLITVMNWMRFWWYKSTKNLVHIEAKTRRKSMPKEVPDRSGLFFSGGIDALSTIRANRLDYPLDHRGSIKDGLVVCGLEIRDEKIFGFVLDSLSILADDIGIALIPIFTNIRSLGPEDDTEFWRQFWLDEFMGDAFAAIAHSFSKRLTEVTVSSCHDIPNIIPYSSHPLINPNYSSSDLRIRHEGITMSRFEKTKLVAGWDLALQHLRVCNRTELYEPGQLNCGECEKCVRTMLALEALGVMEKTNAFHTRKVSEDLVMTAVQLAPNTFPLYAELLAPLEIKGRHDLVYAIKQKMIEYYHAEKRKKHRHSLIEPLIKYDQEHLGGSLRKLKRVILPTKGIWTN